MAKYNIPSAWGYYGDWYSKDGKVTCWLSFQHIPHDAESTLPFTVHDTALNPM